MEGAGSRSSRRYGSAVRLLALIVASAIAALVVVALGLAGFVALYSNDEVTCDAGPKPKRTPPPARRSTSVAWLGPQYNGLRFHSVSYGRPARVNYGEPRALDACSGYGYSFDMSVLTAPRRPETRRRLRRARGPGVRTTRGMRYGCRRSDNPRIALIDKRLRVEVMANTCAESIAASRHVRLASERS